MIGWTVHHGDCREVIKTLADSSIDSVVTDPPYGLGFMGKAWDVGDVAFRAETWAECLRVCKPGAHLLAFGGTRTYHRLACAVEDAGWEIRDQIGWAFGSGFPKSHNLDGEWDGWGTALKPAMEPIVVARKPLIGTVAENMQAHGVGALNIDGCRVPAGGDSLDGGRISSTTDGWDRPWKHDDGAVQASRMRGDANVAKAESLGRWPANVIHDGSPEVVDRFPVTASGKMLPTHTTAGRAVFGQNADGGFTTMETYGDAGSAARFFYVPKADREDREDGMIGVDAKPLQWSSGSKNPGSFQSEGTKKTARNNHPTVKPTDLMRYLCRLVTPKGGVVLDPFTGSGSTGRGASIEGFGFIGIEQDAGYCEIARKRIAAVGSLWTQEQA